MNYRVAAKTTPNTAPRVRRVGPGRRLSDGVCGGCGEVQQQFAGILGRWGCTLGWCTAWLKDFDIARLTFTYPGNVTFGKEPWVQFGLVIDFQDKDPNTVAEQVIESMRDTDPKTRAEMIGGSRDSAEKLGFAYKKPTRW